ncbi:MAG: hypothetical protein HY718_02120 [Planctomycetes bacterium]|nr:hypothetical protein [Planctomycetota bacterium]
MQLTRRSLLLAIVATLPAMACQPATPPAATSAPAQPTAPSGAAPKPTAAPVSGAAGATAPAAAPTAVSRPAPTGSLTFVTGVEAANLDPHAGNQSSNPERNISQQVLEYLVARDSKMAFVPMLATEWRTIDDLTWEFKLRRNVKFHNGEPLTSAAVKFSMDRAVRINKQERIHQNIGLDRVETPDDYTVRIITKAPAGNMLARLTTFFILPPQYYGSASDEVAATKPVGTGPYSFVSWTKGDRVTLEANSDYWGPPPAIKTLTFRAVPENGSRINELLAGGADIISNVPPDQIKSVESATTRLSPVQGFRKIYLGIVQKDSAPLQTKEVRQALNYAIDFDTIGKTILAGYGKRAGSFTGAPTSTNKDLKPYAYDPDKARQLLEKAGHKDGFETTLSTPSGRYNKDREIALALADYLTKVGVRTRVQVVEWSAFIQSVTEKTVRGLYLLGNGASADPIQQLDWLGTKISSNGTYWQNAGFEQLLDQARATVDTAKQLSILHRAEVLAFEEAPVVFLYQQYDFSGVNKRLDFETRPDELVFFKDVRSAA